MVKSEPEKKYRVLIVAKNSTSIKNLPLHDARRLMENIASATVSGKDILKLSELAEIESIELDEEAHVL